MVSERALRVDSTTRGGVCYLGLSGTIDETFDGHALTEHIAGGKMILNLKNISRLSSFGVREWAHAIRSLCDELERVYLVECSPSMVNQMTMVSNFAGSAIVVSVQAPYYCENCGADAEATVELIAGPPSAPPVVACPQCGREMDFDEDPDSFFRIPSANLMPDGEFDAGVYGLAKHLSSASPGAPAEGTRTSFEDEATQIPTEFMASLSADRAPVAGGGAAPTLVSPASGGIRAWVARHRWNLLLGFGIVIAAVLLGLTLSL